MAKRGTTAEAASTTVICLKVILNHSKPPIWRRLLMLESMTLGDLHEAIQAAMGWYDSHLHAFVIGGEQFGDPESLDDCKNEQSLTLKALRRSRVTRFTYTYDFGDDWEHIITIEKAQPALDQGAYPRCVAGKRDCPPEDCGGIWGYEELLAILADPNHPERAERLEWLGDDLTPEDFDIDGANAALAEAFKRS